MQNGKNIFNKNNQAEVVNISPFGIWVLINGNEFFINYNDYPFFKNATVKQIALVTSDIQRNIHWPELDIDIELSALEHPEDYSLVYH